MEKENPFCSTCKKGKKQKIKNTFMVVVSVYFLGATLYTSYILINRLIGYLF